MSFFCTTSRHSGDGVLVFLKHGNFIKIFSKQLRQYCNVDTKQTMLRISVGHILAVKLQANHLTPLPTLIYKMEILIMSTIYVKCLSQCMAHTSAQ